MKTIAAREFDECRTLLNLVFAYEDDVCHELTIRTCAGLVERLDSEFEFHTTWWSFSQFQQPDGLLSAAQSAREADMIFIATNDSTRLPHLAGEWLDLWVPDKLGSDTALVGLVLLNRGSKSDFLRIEDQLQQIAASARLNLFVKAYEAPAVIPPPTHEHSPFDSKDLASIEGVSHWGLNE